MVINTRIVNSNLTKAGPIRLNTMVRSIIQRRQINAVKLIQANRIIKIVRKRNDRTKSENIKIKGTNCHIQVQVSYRFVCINIFICRVRAVSMSRAMDKPK